MSDDSAARLPPFPTRKEVIDAHKSRGGLVAAVFPVHHPRALWRAFDVQPIEVWGPPRTDTTLGDAHLQAYTCAIVRGGLSFVLAGKAEAADFFVTPHACDSTQGLASVLLDFVRPSRPVLAFYVPRGDGPSAVEFLAAEFRALFERLVGITGRRPSPEALLEAVQREEEADAALARLHEARLRLPLADREFYRVARAREYLPAERFTELAAAVLEGGTVASRGRVPVLVSGMLPEPMELFEVLERIGLSAAGDDFACTGRRLYAGGTGSDPFARMADSLLSGAPDATRGCSVQARIDHLLGLARRTGARAAVFHEVKFCEPEAYYLPQVRKALEAEGIRSIVVEVNPLEPLPDQVVTRLEALAETL